MPVRERGLQPLLLLLLLRVRREVRGPGAAARIHGRRPSVVGQLQRRQHLTISVARRRCPVRPLVPGAGLCTPLAQPVWGRLQHQRPPVTVRQPVRLLLLLLLVVVMIL